MSKRPFFWRARKAWYLNVVGKDGKPSKVKIGDTRKQAYEAWKKMLVAAEARSVGDAMFSDLVQAWTVRQTERYKQKLVSNTWLARTLSTLQRLCNAKPDLRVSEMNPEMLRAWLGPCSSNYERTELGNVQHCLRWALKTKVIGENPLADMELPGVTRREGTISLEDHRKLTRTADKLVRTLLWFAWWTGSRPVELRSLRWEQIDANCSRAVMSEHKTASKTGRARVIYFPKNAQSLLKRHRKPSGHVFLNRDGKPWTKDAVTRRVRTLRKRANLDVVAYNYRHGFVTRALVAGVPIATVAELVGHTSTEMISRVYGHLAQETQHLENAVDFLNKRVQP